MRKIIPILILLIVAFTTNGYCKPFHGTLVYSIVIEGLDKNLYQIELPQSYELAFYKNNVRFKIISANGQILQDILTQGNEKVTYLMSSEEQKAFKMSYTTLNDSSNIPQNLNKEEIIEGYICNLYQLNIQDPSFSLVQLYWISNAFDIFHPLGSNSGIGGFFVKGVPGVSIKTISKIEQSGISYTMTFTLKEVRQGKLPKDTFMVPETYTIEEYQEELFY